MEKGTGYTIKARALFMLVLHKLIVLASLNDFAPATDSRIINVKEYILAHYNRKLDIREMARLAGLNPVYLGSLFKKHNGCSIREFINKIRVNTAENLLSTGGHTVSEAAFRCGYEDIFYFSKVFKKYKGYPPSTTFRAEMKEKAEGM